MVVRVIAAPSVPLPRNKPPEIDLEPLFPVVPRRNVSKELAQLEVNGVLYSNWTSVRVEQKWTEAFPVFQFECTEEVPIPLALKGAHFVPGMIVRVYLGGHSAIFGYITERHVGFDATNHGVKLVGVGDTFDLTNSSVPPDKFGAHDGKSVFQFAQDLAQHLGIRVYRVGAVDDAPIDNIQVLPGSTPMQEIDRYARMRNLVIGSNAGAGGLLLIGPHPATTVGALWEGTHILSANVAVRDRMAYHKILAMGQANGSDSANGDPQNKQTAEVEGSSTRNRWMVVIADVADTQHGIAQRALMEKVFTEGSYVEANITVQGWFKDNNTSDDIWRAGEYYVVDSPSLLFSNEVLGCAGCIYEQNDGGTKTTLQLVRPIHMNGRVEFDAEIQAVLKKINEAREAAKKKVAANLEAASKKAEAGT